MTDQKTDATKCYEGDRRLQEKAFFSGPMEEMLGGIMGRRGLQEEDSFQRWGSGQASVDLKAAAWDPCI